KESNHASTGTRTRPWRRPHRGGRRHGQRRRRAREPPPTAEVREPGTSRVRADGRAATGRRAGTRARTGGGRPRPRAPAAPGSPARRAAVSAGRTGSRARGDRPGAAGGPPPGGGGGPPPPPLARQSSRGMTAHTESTRAEAWLERHVRPYRFGVVFVLLFVTF